MSDWISLAEAARILDVHPSVIARLRRRGELTSRRQRPAYDRGEVEALRDERARQAEVREAARARSREPRVVPPDDEHVWLRTSGAAAFLGVTPTAVAQRARRGRLPYTMSGGVRWYRPDLLELVQRADRAKRRRTP